MAKASNASTTEAPAAATGATAAPEPEPAKGTTTTTRPTKNKPAVTVATAPDAAEAEMLALIAERHGAAALTVLDAQIARVESSYQTHATSALARPEGDWVKRFVEQAGPYLVARRRYQGWRDHLASLLDPTAKPTVLPTLGEELRQRIVDAGLIDRMAAAMLGPIREVEGEYSEQLADLDRSIDRINESFGANPQGNENDPITGSFGPDYLLEQTRSKLIERRRLREGLAALAQARTEARQLQAEMVTKAIAAAGGPDAVAGAIREARLISGTFGKDDRDTKALASVNGGIAEVDTHLARLGITLDQASSQPAGSHAASLPGKRSELAARAAALREAIDGRETDAIARLVAQAQEGDEPARCAIEREATAFPSSFRPGFREAITEAKAERSSLAAMVFGFLLAQRQPAPQV